MKKIHWWENYDEEPEGEIEQCEHIETKPTCGKQLKWRYRVAIVAVVLVLILLLGVADSMRRHKVSWFPSAWETNHVTQSIRMLAGVDGSIFGEKTAVEVAVLRSFSDDYARLPYAYPYTAEMYHVMELLVTDKISGKDVPQVIYCLYPVEVSTDIELFQKMIIALEQIGFGSQTMLNMQTGREETFINMFRMVKNGVLPVKNGKLDDSMLELDRWNEMIYLANDVSAYDWYVGQSVNEVKEKIRNTYESQKEIIFQPDDIPGWKAKLAYWCADNVLFGNFHSYYMSARTVRLDYYVGNVMTYNTLVIDMETGEVKYDKLFNIADWLKLWCMSNIVKKCNNEGMIAPERLEKSGYRLEYANSMAICDKKDGEVICVMLSYWRLIREQTNQREKMFKLYYRVWPDGSMQEITAEEWQALRNS